MINVRDKMVRDFRVIDAAWPRTRALELATRTKTRFVVVRRRKSQDDDPVYYLYAHADFLQRLDKSSAPSTHEALAKDNLAPVATLPYGTIFANPRVHTLVVGAQGPIGILPAGKTRVSRSGTLTTPSLPPVQSTSIDESGAGNASRSLVGYMPSQVKTSDTFTLLIGLEPITSGKTSSESFTAPVGTKLVIVVQPLANLALVDSSDGEIEITEPQTDRRIAFKLTASSGGTGQLRVHAYCNGASVATLELSTEVVAKTDLPEPPEVWSGAAISIEPRVAPDLALYILEDDNALTFRLQYADGRLAQDVYGPVTLKTSPQVHFRKFFEDVENVPTDTPARQKTARKKLERKGANLFGSVFPADLRVELWNSRKQIQTVQIMSEEPWIPWELCRLTHTNADDTVEEDTFFAEAFCITRWIQGVTTASRLRFDNWALIVPGDSGLPHAENERQYIKSKAEMGRAVTEIPPNFLDVTEAMESARYDAWHFTGHAFADKIDGDQCAIRLAAGETLRPEDVSGVVENVLKPRPIVFLNGCQSGQGGLTLTGVGGWAQRFLKPHASRHAAGAFIGCYWSIDDGAAFEFAKAFYDKLLSGSPIGEAARHARLANRAGDDPTWLAYTVYADPGATVICA